MRQAMLLRGALGERGHQVEVVMAMRYGSPSLPEVLDKLQAERLRAARWCCRPIRSIRAPPRLHLRRRVRPLRPGAQRAGAAPGASNYHDHEGYIEALRQSVQKHWDNAWPRPSKLVMSFHGVPKRTLMLGDPYHCECHKTARLLATALRPVASRNTW